MKNANNKQKGKTFLGIDPGTSIIGFGVINETNKSFVCKSYGTIRNSGNDKFETYRHTTKSILELIRKFNPTAVAVEKIFFSKNQKTAIAVSEMRGVIMAIFANKNIRTQEFTPLQVKQTICNYGFADKKQVQRMVQMILKLQKPVQSDDAADALAIAICCSALHNS